MKVSNVLESLPGVGKVRAQKLMEELDISASRRVRGLGAKQREHAPRQVQEVTGWPLARGRLIVIAGPSGVGKGSVVQRLLVANRHRSGWSPIRLREDPRPRARAEVDGRRLLLRRRGHFRRMLADGELLEWAPFVDHRSGTPRELRRGRRRAGQRRHPGDRRQGRQQIREKVPDAILIFLEPPSMDELERRLRGRGTEDEERIAPSARDGRLGDGPAGLVRSRGRERGRGTCIVAGRCYHRGIPTSASPDRLRTSPEEPS